MIKSAYTTNRISPLARLRNVSKEEKIGEDSEEPMSHKQKPNNLLLTGKGAGFMKTNLMTAAKLLAQKVRNKSPKLIKSKISPYLLRVNHQSPLMRKSSAISIPRSRSKGSKHKLFLLLPYTQTNLKQLTKVPITKKTPKHNKTAKSSKISPSRISGPELFKALKSPEERRYERNKELWRAVENGDIERIKKLIQSYNYI